jgi:hypothetical protein
MITVLEPDPGSDKFDTSDISEMRSDISDREAVLEPNGDIRPGWIYPTKQRW